MSAIAEKYLSLLKKSLLNDLYLDNEARISYFVDHMYWNAIPPVHQAVNDFLNIKKSNDYAELAKARETGDYICQSVRDVNGNVVQAQHAINFNFLAHTMIGRKRLNNIHSCLDVVRIENVPGDFVETGVWRGGASIFMNGYLTAHNISGRTVWAADSFQGLPKPKLIQDSGYDLSKEMAPYLSVSLDEVKGLFESYELLNENVRILKGWFCDTLPNAPIDKLAILRLDGDLYESTMDGLNNLYKKVSPGGFVIVDDFVAFPQCAQAVHEFRGANGISEQLIPIDNHAVYWRKGK